MPNHFLHDPKWLVPRVLPLQQAAHEHVGRNKRTDSADRRECFQVGMRAAGWMLADDAEVPIAVFGGFSCGQPVETAVQPINSRRHADSAFE